MAKGHVLYEKEISECATNVCNGVTSVKMTDDKTTVENASILVSVGPKTMSEVHFDSKVN